MTADRRPVGFLYRTWLPRVSGEQARGLPADVSLFKSTWAMANYFNAFGPQIQRMKDETGTVSAICGMLKAPMDVRGQAARYPGWRSI